MQNKNPFLYALLSYLSFCLTNSSANTIFVFFAIFLYLAANISLLIYLESEYRDMRSDIISILSYLLGAAFLFFLPQISLSLNGIISLNEESFNRYWLLFYPVATLFPTYIVYRFRLTVAPIYKPVIIAGIIPAAIFTLLILIFQDMRLILIAITENAIQTMVIDPLISLKNQIALPDQYLKLLSYISLNKSVLAKEAIYLMPSVIFSTFAIAAYLTDRIKPLIKDSLFLAIRLFRLPDNLVWVMIVGGFFLIIPFPWARYVAYNVLLIFTLLYFLQGVQVVTDIFNRYKVSFIWRLLFFILLFQFTFMLIFIALAGIFSIWIKPKATTSKENNENE